MDKPKINNLIAKVQGRDLTLKQCADATRELNKMMLYTEELEQLILSGVSQQRELLEGFVDWFNINDKTQAILSERIEGYLKTL
tara:strand:+ start:478 stop:729 length:252 start_codon:yes stop_codon:yes gene_type:complete